MTFCQLAVCAIVAATMFVPAAGAQATAGASGYEGAVIEAELAEPEDLPDVQPPAIGSPPSEAELQDLQTMADQDGITLDDAIARYGWHQSFALLVDEIRQAYPDSFAGARIEGDGQPWIAFAAGASSDAVSDIRAFEEKVFGADSSYGFNTTTYSLDIIENRGFTEAELDEMLTLQHYAVLSLDDKVTNVSSGYDISTGVITIEAELSESTPLSESIQPMESSVTAEQEIRSAAGLDESTALRIVDEVREGDDALYGGDAMSPECTSGFSVKKGSTRGIATAAHCANSLTQRGYSLTFKGSHDGWWGDVQWHTSSVAYEADDFYSGSSSAYRVYLRDVAARGTATEGQRLCRNGKITYKKCDTVYQLNHCSWNTCHLTAMHNSEPSWV
jgi:hypothetical protein